MRHGCKSLFNPGETVVCTDEFRGDRTVWRNEPFARWAKRNGVPVDRMPSRRLRTSAPCVTVRKVYLQRYPPMLLYSGRPCAIRVGVPRKPRTHDTHIFIV